jgi:regulator of Ty1 transposition protein 103
VSLQTAVVKVSTHKATSTAHATAEYEKMVNPDTPVPTAPVHAARLSSLLKTLATAEGAVAESIKARRALIEGLEKMLEGNRTSLKDEEAQQAVLMGRKDVIEKKKRDVEDGIMRGLAATEENSPGDVVMGTTESPGFGRPSTEPERPEVEALTPEPEEHVDANAIDTVTDQPDEIAQANEFDSYDTPPPQSPSAAIADPATDLMATLATLQSNTKSNSNGIDLPSTKKRKLDDAGMSAANEDSAMDGLDEDVIGMLRG